MATNDRRVVAMPLADGRLVVVDDPEVRLRPATAQPWAQTAGPLITAALGLRSRDSAGLFELSPASQNALAHLQRSEVDGYFRGVLRTCDGRTAHQLQLRPAADQRTAPSLRLVDAAALHPQA